MENLEQKFEEIQVIIERLELKIHRKIMEKENGKKELSFTHPN